MFIIIEGIRNLKRAKLTSFMVTVVIGVALLIGGWFFIVTIKLQESSDFFESATEIEAFLEDTLPAERIENLRAELEKNPGVAALQYISKDSAAVIFAQEVGEDIHELLGENPLPPSFRIRLRSDLFNRDLIDSVLTSLSTYEGVEDITAHREFMTGLVRYKNIIWIIHIIAGILIFGVALILISNATRISIASRKKSIEVMKLVGARKSSIKGPFIIEGFTEGLFGGILSNLITLGFVSIINQLTGIAITIPDKLPVVLIGTGSLLGIIGSDFAVRRHLEVM